MPIRNEKRCSRQLALLNYNKSAFIGISPNSHIIPAAYVPFLPQLKSICLILSFFHPHSYVCL